MFEQVGQTYYKNLRVYRLDYQHKPTGLLLYFWVPKDSEVMSLYTFNVNFMTYPWNQKGYPHITEHVVLHGNKKYKNKSDDLFFELYSKTFATILNASTMPNFTNYYASSFSFIDMLNIFDIYFASLFEPLFAPEIVYREGFYWHYDEKARRFSPKGVIFNEMQHARYSLKEARFRAYIKLIYPAQWYRKLVEFGGNPIEMAKGISYKALVRFYKYYYSLENAIFTFAGPFSKQQIDQVLKKLHHLILEVEYVSNNKATLSSKSTEASQGKTLLKPISVEPRYYRRPLIMYFEPSYSTEPAKVDIVLTLPVEYWAAVSIVQWLLFDKCSPFKSLRSAKFFQNIAVQYSIEQLLYLTITLEGVKKGEYSQAVAEFMNLLAASTSRLQTSVIEKAKRSVLRRIFFARDTNELIDAYDLMDFAGLVRLDDRLDFIEWFDNYIEDLRRKDFRADVLKLFSMITARKFNLVYYVPKVGVTDQFVERLNKQLKREHKRVVSIPKLSSFYKDVTRRIIAKDKGNRDKNTDTDADGRKVIPILNVENESFRIPRGYVHQVDPHQYLVENNNSRFEGLIVEFDLTGFLNAFKKEDTWLLLLLNNLLFKPEFYAKRAASRICALRPYVPVFNSYVTTRRLNDNKVLPLLVVQAFFDKSKYKQLWDFLNNDLLDLRLKNSQRLLNELLGTLDSMIRQSEHYLFSDTLYDALESILLPEAAVFNHYFGIYRLPEQHLVYNTLLSSKNRHVLGELLVKLSKIYSYLSRDLRPYTIFAALRENSLVKRLIHSFSSTYDDVGISIRGIKGLPMSNRAVVGVYPMSNQYLRGMYRTQNLINSSKKRAYLLFLYNILHHKKVLPYFRRKLTAYSGGIRFNYLTGLVNLYGYRMRSITAVNRHDLSDMLGINTIEAQLVKQFLPNTLRDLLKRDNVNTRLLVAYTMFSHNLPFEFVHDMWDALRNIDVVDVQKTMQAVTLEGINEFKWGVLTSPKQLKDTQKWLADEFGIGSSIVIDFTRGRIQIPE